MTDTSQISDGYHTFAELYEHRHALFLALLRYHAQSNEVWKSRLHSDGSSFDGWFIVGSHFDGKQVTYHLPESIWNRCTWIEELERSPLWDGHTSSDVVNRINNFTDREDWLFFNGFREDAH
jgi:hypothetical protein